MKEEQTDLLPHLPRQLDYLTQERHHLDTLIAMGVPQKVAQTVVRVSLDESNDMSQVVQFLTILKQIYQNTEKVR